MLAGWVAGYRWKPPPESWTEYLPAAVITVSECLTDFLPQDHDELTAPWHTSLQDAINAAASATSGTETVHLLAMSVPTPHVSSLVNLMDKWIGDHPHPIRLNLTRQMPAPIGEVQGFEVLGFEAG